MRRQHHLKSMIEIWKVGISNAHLRDITQQKIEKFLALRMEHAPALAKETATLPSDGSGPESPPGHAEGNVQLRRPLGLIVDKSNRGYLKAAGEWREDKVPFLDQAEIKDLLETASDEFRPILVTALHTGMRRGEILNLKWADVDFSSWIITVQESKSGKKRTIPIDDTLYETLKVLPSRFQKGYVFPSPVNEGKPIMDLNQTFAAADSEG